MEPSEERTKAVSAGSLRADGVASDITEHQRAEGALSESDRRYQVLFESAGDGIFLSRGSHFVDCNQRGLELFGCAREQLIGNTPAAFSPPRQADGSDSREGTLENIRLALEGQALHFAWQHCRWDGTPFDAEITLNRVDIGGEAHLIGLVRDVTEHKRAQQELRRSREELQGVLASIPDYLWSADIDSQGHVTYRYYSPVVEKITGRPPEFYLPGPERWLSTVHPDDRSRILKGVEAFGTGQIPPLTKEYRIILPDGTVRWVHDSVQVRRQDGSTRIDGVVSDITERKRAEEQLRILSRAVEQSPATVVITDLQGNIEYVNPKFTQLTGYTAEEALGQNPRILKSGLVSVATYEDLWKTVLSGGEWHGEFANKKKNGEIYWESASIVPIRDSGGVITHFLAVKEDITERKGAEEALRESEQRYKDFISNSHEGVWRVGLEQPIPIDLPEEESLEKLLQYGYVAECNLVCARNFSYSTTEELVGMHLRELISSSDQGRLESFRSAVREGWRPRTVEYRGPDKAGSPTHFLRTEVPIVENGMLVHIWGITRDVSELKRVEEERQRSLDQLRALAARLQSVREEARKRVAREIHDQLGQALTAIKIDFSSLVHEWPAGENPPSKRIASILKLVDEAIQAVRRIATELRPGILDDLGLVAALEWAGADFQARTGTTCRLDLPQDDIAVDPEQATAIFRIFQETLTNVARHADASEVDVRLAKEDGNLTLEVHDNGKGIPEDKLSSGESLGILGMRERAMLLGGELTISGLPGNGTTVRVRIPEAGQI
jgi:PAS domain S-box-containing protein